MVEQQRSSYKMTSAVSEEEVSTFLGCSFSTRTPLKSSKCQPISKVRHFDIVEQYLVRDGLPYLENHYYICHI